MKNVYIAKINYFDGEQNQNLAYCIFDNKEQAVEWIKHHRNLLEEDLYLSKKMKQVFCSTLSETERNKFYLGFSIPIGLISALIWNIKNIPLVYFNGLSICSYFTPSGEHIRKIMALYAGTVISMMKLIKHYGEKYKTICENYIVHRIMPPYNYRNLPHFL